MYKIPRLKCDLNFGLPVLSVLGIINSLWSNNYFMAALDYGTGISIDRMDRYLLRPMQNTYYLLSISTAVMLYIGFKNSDKKLIRYWHLSKLLDCALVVTGAIIILATCRFWRYWPYILIALVILGTGWYIITTIQEGYQEIGIEFEPVTVENVFKHFKSNTDAAEKPQENLNEESRSFLRLWGFLKILQFVIILPGIVLIIIITNTENGSYQNDWNIFWYITGLGLCFIFCLIFVWKLIPEKTSSNVNNDNKETEVLS